MAMRLTRAEKEWLAEVQMLLNKCPSDRLGFYTIGDAQVSVYDRRKDEKITDLQDNSNMDFCQAVRHAEAETDYALDFPQCVHSTAG